MVARRLALIAPVDTRVVRQVDWSVVLRVVVEPARDPDTPHDGWPGAPPAGTRCVAYVSVGRDDVPFSRSVEQQAAIRAYVTANGLDVIDLACDIVSGDDDGERTGLEALVRGAPALGATHLIVQDRSRIASRPASGAAGAAVGAIGETGLQPPWLAGLVLIEVQDGTDQRVFDLRPGEALLVPPLIWATERYMTVDAVLLVLCDKPYAAEDYIHSIAEFGAVRAGSR